MKTPAFLAFLPSVIAGGLAFAQDQLKVQSVWINFYLGGTWSAQARSPRVHR